MNPANNNQALPLILTGPKESQTYFDTLDDFIKHILGEQACNYY